jgi:hypothetical protein
VKLVRGRSSGWSGVSGPTRSSSQHPARRAVVAHAGFPSYSLRSAPTFLSASPCPVRVLNRSRARNRQSCRPWSTFKCRGADPSSYALRETRRLVLSRRALVGRAWCVLGTLSLSHTHQVCIAADTCSSAPRISLSRRRARSQRSSAATVSGVPYTRRPAPRATCTLSILPARVLSMWKEDYRARDAARTVCGLHDLCLVAHTSSLHSPVGIPSPPLPATTPVPFITVADTPPALRAYVTAIGSESGRDGPRGSRARPGTLRESARLATARVLARDAAVDDACNFQLLSRLPSSYLTLLFPSHTLMHPRSQAWRPQRSARRLAFALVLSALTGLGGSAR